jgi:hypothetical protein
MSCAEIKLIFNSTWIKVRGEGWVQIFKKCACETVRNIRGGLGLSWEEGGVPGTTRHLVSSVFQGRSVRFSQHSPTISFKKLRCFLHCKKRLLIFPSLAGMWLTKLSLAGNNKIIPGQGEFGQWHPGRGRENRKPFFTVCCKLLPTLCELMWPSLLLQYRRKKD